MIKAVIFDAGGVIITSSDSYAFLAKKVGVSKARMDEVRVKYMRPAQCGELSTDEFLTKLSEEFKVTKEKLRKLFEEGSKLMSVDNEVVKIVDKLNENGYRLAMITNTIEFYSKFEKETEVYRNFSPMVASYQVGVRKPDPKIYEMVLKKLNLKGEECVFIDDHEEHLVPAAKLGMKTILFKNAAQLKRELKKLDVKV
jgi:epoxide hydrolase-like predicted phosphatase